MMTTNGHQLTGPGHQREAEERLDLGLVQRRQALPDAQGHATQEGQRERREATNERGGQGGHGDQQGEDAGAEPADRGHQDAGDAGQRAAHAPGDRGEEVGRPTQRRDGPLVLGTGGDGEADPGEADRRPQHQREDDGDPGQDEPVLLDDDGSPVEDALGKERLHHDGRVAVALLDHALEDDEQAQRGDHPGERRRPPHLPQDAELEHQPDEGRRETAAMKDGQKPQPCLAWNSW